MVSAAGAAPRFSAQRKPIGWYHSSASISNGPVAVPVETPPDDHPPGGCGCRTGAAAGQLEVLLTGILGYVIMRRRRVLRARRVL